MDCRTAQQLITGAVTGDLNDNQRDALAAHCEGCATCRAEWDGLLVLWDRLGHSHIPAPSSDLTDRFSRRLSATALIDVIRSPSRGWAVAAALATLLVGGIGGFALGRSDPTTRAPSAEAASPAYLLLLHGETNAPHLTDTQLIAEYARWAEELQADGRLIEAHRLLEQVGTVQQGDAGAEVGPITAASDDAVSGFFLIHADDMDRAIQVALEGPHARYGGRIEVRPVAR